MYLVVIAWLYVVLMMAVAEATNSNGTVLGAIITFLLYGVLPLGLVIYLMRTPQRRKGRRAQEQAANAAAAQALAGEPEAGLSPAQAGAALPGAPSVDQPDAGGHAPAAAQHSGVAAVRKEP